MDAKPGDVAPERSGLDYLAHRDRQLASIRLAVEIRRLAAGERQKTEIIKQLYLQRKFLVPDEPASVLTPQESAELLSPQCRTTVLLISERLDEILEFADRIVVMHEGQVVHEMPAEGAAPQEIGRHMLGHH